LPNGMQEVVERKAVVLRLSPLIHAALQRWAKTEVRSFNAHVEYLLHKALANAGRLPRAHENRTSSKSDR
jgi:hypothetical protein